MVTIVEDASRVTVEVWATTAVETVRFLFGMIAKEVVVERVRRGETDASPNLYALARWRLERRSMRLAASWRKNFLSLTASP